MRGEVGREGKGVEEGGALLLLVMEELLSQEVLHVAMLLLLPLCVLLVLGVHRVHTGRTLAHTVPQRSSLLQDFFKSQSLCSTCSPLARQGVEGP